MRRNAENTVLWHIVHILSIKRTSQQAKTLLKITQRLVLLNKKGAKCISFESKKYGKKTKTKKV